MYDFCKIMPNKYAESRDNYETQVRNLMTQFAELKKQNIELKKQIKWRQEDVEKLQKELGDLQKNYERLLIAYQLLSDNEDNRTVARKKIENMVREIDKCLNLLLE